MLIPQLNLGATEGITLAWNPATDPTIVGYRIHYGIVSHLYTDMVTVGNTNTAAISGLLPGITYYFAATSLNDSGNESDLSNETSYTVPLPPALPELRSVVRLGSALSFSVAGISGQAYVVQASMNLKDWIPVQTNVAPFTFSDGNTAEFSQRFYRAVPL